MGSAWPWGSQTGRHPGPYTLEQEWGHSLSPREGRVWVARTGFWLWLEPHWAGAEVSDPCSLAAQDGGHWLLSCEPRAQELSQQVLGKCL